MAIARQSAGVTAALQETASAGAVLNPQLYQRLQQCFGPVIIANRGAGFAGEQYFDAGHNRWDWRVADPGEYYRVNCFAPETCVATPSGDIPIRDLVGTTLLLIPNRKGLGRWQPATIRAFGRQPLLTMRLRRRRTVKTLRATPEHRWVVSGRIGLYSYKTTRELQPGDKLASCFCRNLQSYGAHAIIPATMGITRGFVFGDGSAERSRRRSAYVGVYTRAKLAGLSPYFSGCRCLPGASGSRCLATWCDLPRDWKTLPSSQESLSFLLGWFAGYFAADGHVNKSGSQATLFSARPGHLQFVKGICYQLGIRVSPIKPKRRTSDGCVPGAWSRPMYGVSFPVRDLPEAFWLLPHHRARVQCWMAAATEAQRSYWHVEAVEDRAETDEVYCAVVPSVEKFTLADNLLTMNCPFCGDQRHRLWVNHRFGEFDQHSNRRMLHLAICYNGESCLGDWGKRLELCDRLFGFHNRYDRSMEWLAAPGEVEGAALFEATLPGECIPIQDLPIDHPCVNYMLVTRRYPLELLVQYQVSVCTRADPRYRKAQGRVVIPIYIDGMLTGWQARYPADLNWKAAGIPKYYSLPGMAKRQILYNCNVARQYPFVVVCEGTSDVWSTGPYAVALLGKSLSFPQQRRLILDWQDKPIIIMLDGGEEERSVMQHMVAQLLNQQTPRSPVMYVQLPDGRDPGSYTPPDGQQQLLNIIYAKARDAGISLAALR